MLPLAHPAVHTLHHHLPNVIVLVQVVGEFFYEQDCSTRPITVTEMKMQPECVDQKKVTVKYLHRK